MTKWIVCKAISDLLAVTTARFVVDNIIVRHGCPQFIKTDNGTNFSSNVFAKMLELLKIRGVFTTPYHPQANGTVERVNQTIANILQKTADQNISMWPLYLPSVMFAYNISIYSNTGKLPFELLYGQKPALLPILYAQIVDQDCLTPSEYLKRLTNLLIKLHTEAYISSHNLKTQAFDTLNDDRKAVTDFKIDDVVLYLNQPNGYCPSKLSSFWHRPFIIIEKTGYNAFTIKNLESGNIINRVHGKFLKYYKC